MSRGLLIIIYIFCMGTVIYWLSGVGQGSPTKPLELSLTPPSENTLATPITGMTIEKFCLKYECIPASVPDKIRYYATEYDELLVRIAWCESRYNPNAIGKIDSNDWGLYQINQKYNPIGECSFDIKCSTKWVENEIRQGNLWKWSASKWCWNELINKDI